MNDITEVQKNEKLCEMVWPDEFHDGPENNSSEIVWNFTLMTIWGQDRQLLYEGLPFTQSLDALFKWVVPKLEANYCYVSLDSRRTFSTVRPVIWKALIFSNMVVKAKAEDTTPAHALAEAILKAYNES